MLHRINQINESARSADLSGDHDRSSALRASANRRYRNLLRAAQRRATERENRLRFLEYAASLLHHYAAVDSLSNEERELRVEQAKAAQRELRDFERSGGRVERASDSAFSEIEREFEGEFLD